MTTADELVRAGIRPVKRRVEVGLLSRRGVVGVDIGEKVTAGRRTGQVGIVVYVRRKLPAARLLASDLVPSEIEGIATDVVADDVVLHRALLDAEFPPARGAERHRQVLGGISLGPWRTVLLSPPDAPRPGEYAIVGTLGVLATARTRRPNVTCASYLPLSGTSGPHVTQIMGLTTFHAACVDDNWAVGDEMVHPSRVDGGTRAGDVVGTLCRAALSGSVDGAAVLLAPGRSYRPSIVDIGPVIGTAAAARGTVVRKRGRTTGLTTGRIASVDATVLMDYRDGLGVRVLRDQIRIEAVGGIIGDYGDSGSAVVDPDNRVVGLYVAGNSSGTVAFASPIGKVLDELDVDLITD
ncbi:hypothetical protein [Kutzneria chonburiensis]|uniref:Serine protease n=1 Tax=Kutzneria chonburiensis TaxID=1483604 RepID=A0ABV6MX56_9PSEU|nr:hypothetical protein [Kutzneria chonburiensis]